MAKESSHPSSDDPSAAKTAEYTEKVQSIRKRQTEALERMNQAVIAFDTKGRESLQFRMMALQSPGSESAQKNLSDAQEQVRICSDEVMRFVAELRALEEEEKSLNDHSEFPACT